MSDQSLVEIPAADLLAVMPYRADPGDVRYYLEGIVIEPVESGGCMLVASNGHTMGVIYSKDAQCDKPRILNMSREFHRAIRSDPFPDNVVRVRDQQDHVRLSGTNGDELFMLPGKPFIDGKIIDWRKVIPPLSALQPGSPAQLAAHYVARIKRSFTYERSNGITFWQDTRDPKEKGVVVRFETLPELIVILMPLRQLNATTWPEWYPKGEKPAEAAA